MPYASIRITLDPSNSRTRCVVENLFLALKRHFQDDEFQSTCGYETLNKYGEPCSPHYHFNFRYVVNDLKDPKRSLVSLCRKYAVAHGFELKGPHQWCCQLFPDPDDLDHISRWFRYPLKENPIQRLCVLDRGSYGASTSDSCPLPLLCLLAKDERQRSVESNCLAREKSRNKTQFKDRMFTHLDKVFELSNNHHREPSHKEIWIAIVEYYRSEDKPINFQTIDGYTTLYQLHISSITPASAYENRIIKSNQFT